MASDVLVGLFRNTVIKSGSNKVRQVQQLAISKESTYFFLSSWNLVKIITSWGDLFHQVSWEYDKKWGFLIGGWFLNVSNFFDPDFRLLRES